MTDFFVLVGSNENPVYRIQLDRSVQDQLAESLQRDAERITNRLDFFEPGHGSFNPDETEAWRIPEMELPDALQDAIDNPIGVPVLRPKQIAELHMRALIGVFGTKRNRWAAFQIFDTRNVLLPDRLALIFSKDVFTRFEEPGLLIGDNVHAVLDKDGAFIFEKMYWARRLFDMAVYFEEATDEEVEDFLEHDNIYVDDHDEIRQNLSAWARKRISIVLRSGILNSESPKSIKKEASSFGIDIKLRKGKLVLPADPKKLKRVLKFLEEDYYTGPLTGSRFVANSKSGVTP